jgi:hypothetical protein
MSNEEEQSSAHSKVTYDLFTAIPKTLIKELMVDKSIESLQTSIDSDKARQSGSLAELERAKKEGGLCMESAQEFKRLSDLLHDFI